MEKETQQQKWRKLEGTERLGCVSTPEEAVPVINQDILIGDPVFITQANLASIIWKFKEDAPVNTIAEDLYTRPIYIQTERDHKWLKTVQWAFQHPDQLMEWCYQKHEGANNHNLIFASRSPAYHKNKYCLRMLADYQNIEIPAQIEVQEEAEKTRFKQWANQHHKLFEENQELFKIKLCTEFDIPPSELRLVVYENSGYALVGNENLDEICRLIDKLLCEAEAFYTANEKHQKVLDQYRLYTGLGYSSTRLHSNRTGYPEKEVKGILKSYRARFQKPLNRFLMSYLRVRYNPELTFSGKLLEQLGFKPCRHCHVQQQTDALIF